VLMFAVADVVPSGAPVLRVVVSKPCTGTQADVTQLAIPELFPMPYDPQ
jgi:hypothetical protein